MPQAAQVAAVLRRERAAAAAAPELTVQLTFIARQRHECRHLHAAMR